MRLLCAEEGVNDSIIPPKWHPLFEREDSAIETSSRVLSIYFFAKRTSLMNNSQLILLPLRQSHLEEMVTIILIILSVLWGSGSCTWGINESSVGRGEMGSLKGSMG